MEKLEKPSHWPDSVSSPFAHDPHMASVAAANIQSIPLYGDMQGLRLALTLQEYMNSAGLQIPEVSERRSRQLISAEQVAWEKRDYVPTIGLEIEFPQLLSSSQQNGDAPLLARLYDLIHETTMKLGIPENVENSRRYNGNFLLELTTLPSYSPRVQAFLLAAFLRCEFIPHLEGISPDEIPHIIYESLAQKGISLHINLKIPEFLNSVETSKLEEDMDIETIMGAFAIVYSTSERLKERYNREIYHIKEIYFPFQPVGGRRLEGIPFEVRERQVYRLIEELPYAFSAVFALLANRYELPIDSKQYRLADLARQFIVAIEKQYKKHNIRIQKTDRRKSFYVECAKNPKLKADLDRELHVYVRKARALLEA